MLKKKEKSNLEKLKTTMTFLYLTINFQNQFLLNNAILFPVLPVSQMIRFTQFYFDHE